MHISKHNHSCLLIKDQGKVVLIDPGNFTYQERALKTSDLTRLDYMLITHEHQDHMDVSFIKELVAKFPQVKIITTNSAVALLAKEDIKASATEDELINVMPAPHEKIWMGNPVENIMITIFDRLSHPGDSLTFDKTAEILALPIAAPWGSTTWAVEVAEKLKPKIIIPIHDWLLKDTVRRNTHQRLADYFAKQAIRFIPLENNQIIEL